MTSGLPFDDIRSLISALPPLNAAVADQVRRDLAQSVTDSLGRIEKLAAWFAGATGRAPARVNKAVVALFAATHAVSRRLGVADPVGSARARVEEIAAGAAPVSHLCAAGNLGLNVFDLALEMPVEDITRAPALDERAAAATMAFGMEAVATGADLVCLGTADDSADFAAKALLSALAGTRGIEWPGQESVVITEALTFHRNHLEGPLEAMRRLGGREIAALAGAILAARTQGVAVILDGIAATSAAAALHALNPDALGHCLIGASASEAHYAAAARIGLTPLLDLSTTEAGVAAAVAAGMVKSAGDISAGMAEVRARHR